MKKLLKSNCFDKVIVSTDDIEISDYVKSIGAEVPFLRPEHLSDDYTNSFDVIQYNAKKLLEIYKDLKYICCMYATALISFLSDIKSLRLFQQTIIIRFYLELQLWIIQ